MSESPNKLIRFWQELKRRKTGKVIVAYAATAFILLQLADILTPALLLPEWTTRLITLILVIGFPVAVIFSWVFDITPEGIKKTESPVISDDKETLKKPARRIISATNIIISALIIVVAILAYPKIFKQDTMEKLRSSGERISVAVLPFRNMTNDTTWNIWQNGIQNELINHLTNNEELEVRQTESVNRLIKSKELTNYTSITPSIAGTISQKLDASVFIYGDIKQAGSIIRVNAQLIDSKTEVVFKSFQIESSAKEKNIFQLIDSLSVMVRDYLIISVMKKEASPFFEYDIGSTKSPDALRNYLDGQTAFYNRDYPVAREMLLNAIKIDSNYTIVLNMLVYSYGMQGLFKDAKRWCLTAYEKRDKMPKTFKILTEDTYAICFGTPYEESKSLRQLLDIDDQDPIGHFNMGNVYQYGLQQYDNAIPEYENSLEIFKKWDIKPKWVYSYTELGRAYHESREYKKEKKLYRKAEQDFPDDPLLIYRQAVLALFESKPETANNYIEKYKSVLKENSATEATITTDLACLYSEAGILDKAEEYFRQALSLEPDSTESMNTLAFFLIDNDRNIDEGLGLIDNALELSPDNYNYLHTKGWGFYKQGKYSEALDLLQKSWDIRREEAIYNHEAFVHLEAAKKAVADQKNK